MGPGAPEIPTLPEASEPEAPSPSSLPASSFFATTSFWNEPLSARAEIDPESPRLVGALNTVVNAEVSGKFGPWLSTTGFSTPLYTVSATQATVRVALENNNPVLQQAFAHVPVPAGAAPANGTDAQMVIWQPSKDRIWEFWKMHREAGEWHAKWGGAMAGVSESAGYYGPSSWTGAQSNWGATATSLPLVGGLITLADLERGTIDHALALAYPETEAGIFRFPAQRTDGKSSGPDAIPEGTRFRLDPTLKLAPLHLPHLTLMVAQAAQRYGIVLRDTSAVVDFYGQDPTPTGADPFAALFEGERPWQLLAQFPWSHLEVLAVGGTGSG